MMASEKQQDKHSPGSGEPNSRSGSDTGPRRPGVLQILQSTLAAAFGVQSQKARERDFTHGRPLPYIIAGVVFTIVFIVTLVVIVNVVLNAAGA